MKKSETPKDVVDFFFNDTATTEIYTLSLHDALPILTHIRPQHEHRYDRLMLQRMMKLNKSLPANYVREDDYKLRSEEHTSELQSRPHISYAVFCLKKKTPDS